MSWPPLFIQGEDRRREGQAPEPWSGVQGPGPTLALLGDQGVPANIQAGTGWRSHLQRDTAMRPRSREPAVWARVRPACFRSTCLLGLLIIFFLQSAVLPPTAFLAATVFVSRRALWSVSTPVSASYLPTRPVRALGASVIFTDVLAPDREGQGAASYFNPEPFCVWFTVLLSVDGVFLKLLLSCL